MKNQGLLDLGLAVLGLAAVLLIAGTTLIAGSGVQPDEYRYMQGIFYQPISENPLGNYLFSWVFSATDQCGLAWYSCSKILNLGFIFLGAAMAAVLVLRSTNSLKTAAISGLVFLIGPSALYSPFLMPDTMAAVLTILAIVSLSTFQDRGAGIRGITPAVVAGFALGLAWLSKPHTVAAIAGLAGYLLFVTFVKRSDQRTLAIRLATVAIVVAFTIRLTLGLLLAGPNSLQFFGSYGGLTTSVASEATDTSIDVWSGILALASNLAPLAVLISVALLSLAALLPPRTLLRHVGNPSLGVPLFVTTSYAAMSAAFAFLLELGDREEASFRTLTRYWEFALVGVAIGLLVFFARRDKKAEARANFLSVAAIVSLFFPAAIYSAVYLAEYQSPADSSVFRYPALTLIASGISVGILLFFRRRPSVRPENVLATLLILIGGAAWLGEFRDAPNQVAGTSVGQWITEQKRQYPMPADEIVFIGDRTIAQVSAFTARLPEANIYASPVYSTVSADKLMPGTRFVIASREVYFDGDFISAEVIGDQIVYHLFSGEVTHPKDFVGIGITTNVPPKIVHWGAWYDTALLRLDFGADFDAREITLDLVGNRTLDTTLVRVDWGEGEILGELRPNQELTPIRLIRQDGKSWANQTIQIEVLGSLIEEDGYSNFAKIGVANLKRDRGN